MLLPALRYASLSMSTITQPLRVRMYALPSGGGPHAAIPALSAAMKMPGFSMVSVMAGCGRPHLSVVSPRPALPAAGGDGHGTDGFTLPDLDSENSRMRMKTL